MQYYKFDVILLALLFTLSIEHTFYCTKLRNRMGTCISQGVKKRPAFYTGRFFKD
ncbi:hypothetical protein HMPREF5175_00355 [Lactobacillus gasseri SV-16A-US]|uniref:Uncharacterized protein n=1 Tax=Lactobacillus gasseri SV-16A-US TaxID=575604 RepID=A0AB34P1H3_LACGS|nr:hypothetical protein HMPREF0516_00339 [Lactobacillus gasseri SJ-9E-US]KFL97517.1 hypothetical protein HMPREF5175_00355 [Lactobacillus gasseri SV-16A-US]